MLLAINTQLFIRQPSRVCVCLEHKQGVCPCAGVPGTAPSPACGSAPPPRANPAGTRLGDTRPWGFCSQETRVWGFCLWGSRRPPARKPPAPPSGSGSRRAPGGRRARPVGTARAHTGARCPLQGPVRAAPTPGTHRGGANCPMGLPPRPIPDPYPTRTAPTTSAKTPRDPPDLPGAPRPRPCAPRAAAPPPPPPARPP